MRIGELARRTGTTAKTLRFYEQTGLLPQPVRTESGYRDYDEDALDRLRFVRAAQSAGLTLADIRDVMAARDLNGPPCEHVTALLDRHADELDQRIAKLIATRTEVQRLRARARTLDPGECTAASVCHVIDAQETSR